MNKVAGGTCQIIGQKVHICISNYTWSGTRPRECLRHRAWDADPVSGKEGEEGRYGPGPRAAKTIAPARPAARWR